MKIVQISDTHLFASDELDVFGVKSNLQFKEVITKIQNEDGHDADMIFLTGDISQDETIESYQKAVSDLAKLNIPVYWIPGNHDNILRLESVFKNTENFYRKTRLLLPGWHFIFLNTKIEGADEGYLSPSELAMLSNELATSPPDKRIAIVMHHHPASVGTPLIDKYILKNLTEFWSVVMRGNVALVMCGHVHGDYQFEHNNIAIESSPATCFQFEKGITNLKIDTKIGYKVYNFDQNSYKASAKIW